MRTRWLRALAVSLCAVLSLTLVRPVRAQGPASALFAPCDGGDGLYLYADRNYAGQCLKVTEDTPMLGDLGFSDVTSSIRFVGTFSGGHRTAELYVDGNYGGDIQIVHGDVPWMGDTVVGNDRLSSVRLGFTCAGVTQIPQGECQALVDLYSQTHGPSWTARDHWLQTQPCDWYGVYCAGGHVQSVILVADNLDGSLPSSLGNLASLSNLRLSTNLLVGNIPSSLGNLGNLSLLDLSGNGLEGSIPSSLGDLSQLESLFLYHNALTGGIPSSLGNLSQLEYLYLYHNALTGGIPSSLSSLSLLRHFSLASNELTGNIPDSFRYLKSLVGLYVQDNPLGGALPMSLMEMTALEAFHFEETGLCEPPDAAFQAWLAGMLECGRTGVLCSEPLPTPTATGIAVPSPTPTRTTVPGVTPTPTATRTGGAPMRVYLPVLLRGYPWFGSDEFGATTLDWRWSWLREDPTHWSLSAHPGFLRITSQPGTLFYAGNDARNLLLREPPPGDWDMRTRVVFLPTESYQLAGLVIYGDDDNFMLLAHGFCGLAAPTCVGNGSYFDLEQGGADVGGDWMLASPGSGDAYLRVVRRGGMYTGLASADGVNWTALGVYVPGPGFPAVRVGLLAMNHGMSPDDYFDIPADFDWFQLTLLQ